MRLTSAKLVTYRREVDEGAKTADHCQPIMCQPLAFRPSYSPNVPLLNLHSVFSKNVIVVWGRTVCLTIDRTSKTDESVKIEYAKNKMQINIWQAGCLELVVTGAIEQVSKAREQENVEGKN